MKTAGILALQGDFEAHRKAVERAGGHAIEVRTLADLEQCDGLIIPGGESTTMLKLLDEEGLTEPLKRFSEHKPVYGSCAGAILLAREVTHPAQPSLGLMDITVERNAYGRQIDSRIALIPILRAHWRRVHPRSHHPPLGPGINVTGKLQRRPSVGGSGRHMVTTLHPELTGDTRVHRRFLEKL